LPKLPIEASPVKPKWTSSKSGCKQGWLFEGQDRFYKLCKEVATDRRSEGSRQVETELLASWQQNQTRKRKRSIMVPDEEHQLNMVVYDENGNEVTERTTTVWDKVVLNDHEEGAATNPMFEV
jgi:hypothetical protein